MCSWNTLFIFSMDDLLRDTDSEVEEDDDRITKRPKAQPMKQKRKVKSYLQEDENAEEIIDFMDPSAASKVFGKNN